MKIAVYHRSVPNQKNQEKVNLLRFFSQGAAAAGDLVVDVETYQYVDSDVAVIQGWINDGTTNGKPRPHLQLRKEVIDRNTNNQRHVVAVDSNLFLYADTANKHHYLRYSFDGIFPTTGIYCDTQVDPARWVKISQDLKVELKPYRRNGNHILLCLQRNGGWSMGGIDVLEWAAETIVEIRKYTDRSIVIRPHPGDKFARDYLGEVNNIQLVRNIRMSDPLMPLTDDLKRCWAAVNYNSSPVVGAAIEGIPIFVTDVEKSQCRDIANTDLSQIENPAMPDRQAWVERLAMSHWNFDELQSGECWNHMRKFIL
jgi:hypothetical protein